MLAANEEIKKKNKNKICEYDAKYLKITKKETARTLECDYEIAGGLSVKTPVYVLTNQKTPCFQATIYYTIGDLKNIYIAVGSKIQNKEMCKKLPRNSTTI